jgi:alkylhydroperoxidase family enzyme
MGTHRIAPLEGPFEAGVAGDLAALMPPGIPPIAIFRAAAHNPRCLARMRGGNLLDRGSITRRERELVILRACARAGAEYEWGVHAAFFAQRVGISEADVDGTVKRQASDPVWAAQGALLMEMVDALHETADIPDALWERLAAHWTAPQLVELTMLAGQYRMISGMVKAWRLEPEPFARRFPMSEDEGNR